MVPAYLQLSRDRTKAILTCLRISLTVNVDSTHRYPLPIFPNKAPYLSSSPALKATRQIFNMHYGGSTLRLKPMTWWMGLICLITPFGTRSSSSLKRVSTLQFLHLLHVILSVGFGDPIPPALKGSGRLKAPNATDSIPTPPKIKSTCAFTTFSPVDALSHSTR